MQRRRLTENQQRHSLCTGCYGNLLCFSSASFHLFTVALKQFVFLVSFNSSISSLSGEDLWPTWTAEMAAGMEVKPYTFGPAQKTCCWGEEGETSAQETASECGWSLQGCFCWVAFPNGAGGRELGLWELAEGSHLLLALLSTILVFNHLYFK